MTTQARISITSKKFFFLKEIKKSRKFKITKEREINSKGKTEQ